MYWSVNFDSQFKLGAIEVDDVVCFVTTGTDIDKYWVLPSKLVPKQSPPFQNFPHYLLRWRHVPPQSPHSFCDVFVFSNKHAVYFGFIDHSYL
jgi:hypothetical protein